MEKVQSFKHYIDLSVRSAAHQATRPAMFQHPLRCSKSNLSVDSVNQIVPS